ncbi:MAG: restriction endonuclease [Cyclobacteriaceae bacterium]
MDWKDYEEVTRYIYEGLGKKAGVKIEGVGNTCRVKGKSGASHQIDILTKHSDGVHTYRAAIECKYWQDKVNKDIVMKVAGIIEDAGINKGIIVSKMGFTDDAVSIARYRNIELVELREMDEADRKQRNGNTGIEFAMLNIGITCRRPEILDIIIDSKNSGAVSEKRNHYQLSIHMKNGQDVPMDEYIMSFKTEELQKQTPDKVFEKYYTLPNANLVSRVTKESMPINGFTLKGKLTVTDMSKKLTLVDEIWLIMKSMFDDKSFTVSHMGMIQEE